MFAGSSRDPTANHIPTETERASGMRSVMRRTPEASSDRSISTSFTDAAEKGSATTVAASTSTVATVAAATVLAGRAEIAEFRTDLGIECVFE